MRVVSEAMLPVRVVQTRPLREGLAHGLCRLTDCDRAADAWHRILKPDDKILIKFNQSAAGRIATSAPMASELVDSLAEAGWDPAKITVLEAGDEFDSSARTRPPDRRWIGATVDFGASGRDSFMAAVDQSTAIINVPFLKTHHRATMTGCLKNLSHGLIRHPARFHANGCDPAIGEIVASEPIRSRLRLNIVNGLRVVFDGGPDAADDDMHNLGGLLLSRDPVACDTVGFDVLNEVRQMHGRRLLLPDGQLPGQITTAARLGVGISDMDGIEIQTGGI